MGKDKEQKERKAKQKLPEHLQVRHDNVICGPELNANVNTVTSANTYRSMDVDNSWDFQEFKDGFEIIITSARDDALEFDMVGADPAIANALRRILIAEVPTIAIEHVFISNNTSIIQDEVLAHRLGLVPLLIEPEFLEFKVPEEAPSEKNTVVFKMDVTCRRKQDGSIDNEKVLSESLQWLPGGSELPDETSCRFAAGQAHAFSGAGAPPRPAPVHKDILLAKLRPGQTIQLEAHCTKGTGKEHAKWSPVATAWYRPQPEVVLLQPVLADSVMGRELRAECEGLFVGDGNGYLQVTSAREHAKVLEKLRRLLEQQQYVEAVQYRKNKTHFIFTIESTGILPPEELLDRALQILEGKAHSLAQKL